VKIRLSTERALRGPLLPRVFLLARVVNPLPLAGEGWAEWEAVAAIREGFRESALTLPSPAERERGKDTL